VLVRIIADRFAHDPRVVLRFRREAELCARLAHPKIVAILDAGDEPRDFIVMELVRGPDAGTLMERTGRFTAAQTVHVIAQVCEALEYAHGEDVVHHDVSPGKILIGLADGTAKLAGFGVTGTPGYVAPEILRGAKPSPRSDLYSLGVVAYRLLTGPAAMPMAPLAEARRDLPRGLQAAVEQALADDPDERQASVAELRAQLLGEHDAPRLRDVALFPAAVREELPSAA
jgi:eukaryotic-like serine/threonine-protein kinase